MSGKRTLRSSMFETDSSSVHSIVYSNMTLEPSKLRTRNGYTITDFGEFGREFRNYTEQAEKLSYLASLIWYVASPYELSEMYDDWNWKQLEEAVCKYNGTNGIRIGNKMARPYIDHQSVPDSWIDFIDFDNVESLRQFVFCPNMWLRTDCD